MSGPTEKPKAVMTYAGRRRTGAGKLVHTWICAWLPESDRLNHWDKMKKPRGPIGGVFEVEHDGDPNDGLYLGTTTWTGATSEPHAELFLEWAAADKACAARDAADKAASKAARDALDIGAMTIDDARFWMSQARGGQRTARRLVILEALAL